MIRHTGDMRRETRAGMRGGCGEIELAHVMEEQDMHGKSRLLAQLTLPQGASIGVHDHTQDAELYLIVRGEATVTEKGAERVLYPGDAMFTGGGDTHSVENRGSEPLVLYAVVFN